MDQLGWIHILGTVNLGKAAASELDTRRVAAVGNLSAGAPATTGTTQHVCQASAICKVRACRLSRDISSWMLIASDVDLACKGLKVSGSGFKSTHRKLYLHTYLPSGILRIELEVLLCSSPAVLPYLRAGFRRRHLEVQNGQATAELSPGFVK